MACNGRPRHESECSTVSSDSSLLDGSDTSPPYASVVEVESYLLEDSKVNASRYKGRNCYRRIAVVSLCISVVCLVVTSVLGGCGLCYVYFGGVGNAHEKVCMPCSDVSSIPMEEFESPVSQMLEVTVGEDGESTCCAHTPAQYAALFKLILKRQEAVKRLADVLGSPNSMPGVGANGADDVKNGPTVKSLTGGNAVSAHLLSKPMTAYPSEVSAIQQWKSPEESPVSHVRLGIKFHENKLFVQVAGLYFVYCQIMYHKAGENAFPQDIVASNYVKRHSLTVPAASSILLKARHTSGDNDRHSSWVGGLFFLHVGDQLFVEVSSPELISHDDTASFFGLFKIGN